jgi:hypothetical protein
VKGTFTATRGNGKVATIPALQVAAIELLASTHSHQQPGKERCGGAKPFADLGFKGRIF